MVNHSFIWRSCMLQATRVPLQGRNCGGVRLLWFSHSRKLHCKQNESGFLCRKLHAVRRDPWHSILLHSGGRLEHRPGNMHRLVGVAIDRGSCIAYGTYDGCAHQQIDRLKIKVWIGLRTGRKIGSWVVIWFLKCVRVFAHSSMELIILYVYFLVHLHIIDLNVWTGRSVGDE